MSIARKATLLIVLSAVASCADRVTPPQEIARVRTHLERVVRELQASRQDNLKPAQLEARAKAISLLQGYIIAQRYPTNDVSTELTPIFADKNGARCAMAALQEATGHGAFVARVAKTHNLAYIEEL